LTFLVDANVIIYSAVPSKYREACLEILEAIAKGEADGRLSTAILEEVWHLELSGRAGALDGLARQTYLTFSPLLAVSDQIIGRALDLEARRLGSNDRIHVATALAHEIDTIVSADAAFDEVPAIVRIDPLSDAERSRLLRT
jgi:predicted nucleic acid-binding protein